jgi:hypothetical protein
MDMSKILPSFLFFVVSTLTLSAAADLKPGLLALRADLQEDARIVERALTEYQARLEVNQAWRETLNAPSMDKAGLKAFLQNDFSPALEPPVSLSRGALNNVLDNGHLDLADPELATTLRSLRSLYNRHDHYKVRNFDITVNLVSALFKAIPIGGGITDGPLAEKMWEEVDLDESLVTLSSFITIHFATILSMNVFYEEFNKRLPGLLAAIEVHLE